MKNYCQVCGKPCEGYVLCKDCFEEMQRGNLEKCKNCGRWYRIGDICQCFKIDLEEKDNTEESSPEACKNDESNEEESKGCLSAFLVSFFCVIFLLILFSILASEPWEDNDKSSSSNNSPHSDNKTNIVTQITKDPPDVSFKDSQNITDLKNICILVEANDDYKEVIVEICLYDKNGTVIVKKTLTETNLKKGNTYELTYNMSWSEALKCEKGSCQLISYK